MKLYHISEESHIETFIPRQPVREDLKESPPLVWAIDEKRMVNFFTPRNCPRLTYHVGDMTSEEDKRTFFSSDHDHVLVIEHDWVERMKNTKIYLYEFDPKNFELQDDLAGYYTSQSVEKPIKVTCIDNLFQALADRNVEIRIVSRLWYMREKIIKSSLNYSLCRMGFAQEK